MDSEKLEHAVRKKSRWRGILGLIAFQLMDKVEFSIWTLNDTAQALTIAIDQGTKASWYLTQVTLMNYDD